MKDYTKLASKIVKEMGGKENISKAYNCFTRLRFNVYDESKVNENEMNELSGTMGIRKQSGQYQIIIGNEVADVFKAVAVELGYTTDKVPSQKIEFTQVKTKKFKFSVSSLMDVIASLFGPIIGVIAGAGVFMGIGTILLTSGAYGRGSDTDKIMNLIGNSAIQILPLLLSVTAAKKFDANPYMALAIVAVLLSPTMVQMQGPPGGDANYIYLFEVIPVPVLNYSGAIFPTIFAVYALSWLEYGINKIVPKMFRVMVVPLIALVILIPFTLALFGPLGNYIGMGLAWIIAQLFNWQPWFGGLLYGAVAPILIIFGMHYAIMPVALEYLQEYGANPLGPLQFISAVSQAGASLAIFFMLKNKEQKQVTGVSTVTAMIGITEPTLFGTLMKHRQSLVAVVITSGIAGSASAAIGCASYQMGLPSWISMPIYFKEGHEFEFISLIVIGVLSLAASFGLTYLIGINEYKDKTSHLYEGIKWYEINKKIKALIQSKKIIKECNLDINDRNKRSIKLLSIAKGRSINFEDLKEHNMDEYFSKDGKAINAKSELITAPVDGKIDSMSENGSSIVISNDEGLRVLIHFGAEKEPISNDYFKTLVIEEQDIKTGQQLMELNLVKLKEDKIKPIVYVVILEKPAEHSIEMTQAINLNTKKTLLKLVPNK